jgi:3-oxo-5-alpha-steroid 4-dehydrogenase 1
MLAVAIIVFISLYFVEAGYGKFQSTKWGLSINNRLGWFLMESPVFFAMLIFLILCPEKITLTRIVIFALFQLHYVNRALIFPFTIKGKGQIPVSVMSMGIMFNLLNATMQGYWLFFESYKFEIDQYTTDWLMSMPFIIGTILFFVGLVINQRSDYIVSNLRKDKFDTKHYLPSGGMFNYVTSANYFGEIIEWLGFAILSFSLAGFVFFVWTFANLVPRAHSIFKKYTLEFSDEMQGKKLRAVFPFIY